MVKEENTEPNDLRHVLVMVDGLHVRLDGLHGGGEGRQPLPVYGLAPGQPRPWSGTREEGGAGLIDRSISLFP